MISKALFIAITWLFFALAAASSFARLVPKRRRYARDTCLSYFALFTLLASCTLNNIFASTYFHLSYHKEDRFRSCSSLSRLLWVSSTLNTTCLWLVKASLLASYHRFVDENASLKWVWYLVVSTTTFAYSSCVIAYPFPSDCIFGKASHDIVISHVAIWIFTVWDITSNMLLIAFPLTVFLTARISRRTKVSAALFSTLVLIVMALSIIRTATSHMINGFPKVFWLLLWGAVQSSVFLTISNCLAIPVGKSESHTRSFPRDLCLEHACGTTGLRHEESRSSVLYAHQWMDVPLSPTAESSWVAFGMTNAANRTIPNYPNLSRFSWTTETSHETSRSR
ncbi:hypothetical protein BS50DRAFT_580316 [Corynespora cassiicola Philippines]|uniref:Rhodopsin domain-containing protein n=1 Tax=Corynespora cassiicola Philippines TaxID=1448308 RepID=A0A2T2N0M7_CORCC|nr:hypothetical protein BS50DRAFT_580316 [Corynespora cassiicola Philippines]